MPDVKIIKCSDWREVKPAWSFICGIEIIHGNNERGTAYHYHDYDEYHIIAEGEADVLLDSQKFHVRKGDTVAIPYSSCHCVLSSSNDFCKVVLQDTPLGPGRSGSVSAPSPRKFIGYMGKYDDGMVTYDDVPAEKCKIVPPRTWFWLKQKPAWSRLTNVGVNDYAKGENEPDYHRHECHEVYILAAGNLIAHVDGKMLDIHPGDCVPIAMGTRHQVYQVPRPSILVFFYSELHGLKRYGHIEENKENWIL